MKKVGIYGGTFDPIHFGHLNLAREMREKHGLDEIWLCPVRYSPHKVDKEISSVEHRLKMVELAIEDEPGFKAVDFEIKRDGPSYTVDTLEELHQKFSDIDFYLILGDDSVKSFLQWKEPKRIVRLAKLLVGSRHPGEKLEFPEEADPTVVRAIKKGLTETSLVNVSATEIRERVRQGKSLEGLLPQKIIDYIVANDLYLAKIKKQTTILKLLDKAAQTIFDKKGFNILALDVSDVSSMTDYFLIAEGNVDRHVIALGDELRHVLKKEGERPFHVEGDQSGDWLVMDYGDFVIHLFQSEMREKYALEELWHDAKVVDLNIDVSHE